jgi:hypothetical protein
MLGSCVRDREARADGQGRELIDRVAAGAPVRQLLLVEALGHARHSPGSGRITTPGSSWPQSMRIVQRKRRPTSKVDSMIVLRARRGATGSK